MRIAGRFFQATTKVLPCSARRAQPGICKAVLSALCAVLLAACQPNGADALLRGERQLREGRIPEAIESFQTAARLMPGDWRPHNYWGMALHRAGKLEEAGKQYDQALAAARRQPASARESGVLQYNLGRLYSDMGRHEQAALALATYTIGSPGSFDGFLWRGAAESAAAAQSNQPQLLERAESSLQKAVQLNAGSATAYNRLGVVQMQRGFVEKAKASFHRAHQIEPAHAPALYNLAEAYWRHPTGDRHAARQLAWKFFQEYLQMDGELAHKEAAQAVFNQLNFELNPPVATLPPATKGQPATNPLSPLAPLVESNIVVRMQFPRGNGQEPQRGVVITNFPPVARVDPPKPPPAVPVVPVAPPTNQTVKVVPPPVTPEPPKPAPTVPVAKVNPPAPTVEPPTKTEPPKPPVPVAVPTAPKPPAVVAAVPKQDQDWGGIARYRYAAPSIPGEGDRKKANEHFEKALHSHKINRLKDAMAAYREALKADPAYPQAHANLALVAFHTGDLKQAMQSYEMALAINPLSLDARYNFALALQRGKFPVDAARELERLLEDYPQLTQAHLLLANLYAEELARPLRAKPHYAKVLQIDPGHEQAPNIRQWLRAHP